MGLNIALKLPSSLKSPQRGRGTGFSKQEILVLAKAYIGASMDPVIVTLQSEDTFMVKFAQCTINWLHN